jgi:hypothetical protein
MRQYTVFFNILVVLGYGRVLRTPQKKKNAPVSQSIGITGAYEKVGLKQDDIL